MQVTAIATFSCAHCAALYEVSVIRQLEPQRDAARCTCCAQVMTKWRSHTVPSFRLLRERSSQINRGRARGSLPESLTDRLTSPSALAP